jgi:hypothetical protein
MDLSYYPWFEAKTLNQDIPTINRQGILRFPNGPIFSAPVVVSPKPRIVPVQHESSVLEWRKRDLALSAGACRSGPCMHAAGIVCRCHCKGKAHRSARDRGCHALEEYTQGPEPVKGEGPTPTLLKVARRPLEVIM